MANIQINASPPAVALIGEGLQYEIERTDLPATAFAEVFFLLPSVSTAYTNKYIEIVTYGGTLKFYWKATPDESGLQLRDWDQVTPDTYTEFLDKVVEDIAANFLINKYYKVVATSQGFKLTARIIGPTYDASLSGTDVTSLTEGTNTTGIADSTPADYEIYVAPLVYAATEVLIEPEGEDLFNLDPDNKVFPDVAEYLISQIKSSFTFPYNTTKVIEVPDAVVKYYIRYAEFEDDTIKQLHNSYASPKYAIAGRLKQIDSDFLADTDSDFFDYINNEKKFLSWCPLTKNTYAAVAERLFFLTETTGLKLMRKAYYADDSTSEVTVQTITQAAYSIIEILCGVPELFTPAQAVDLVKYDVWIVNSADEQVSEFRTFIVDDSTYLNTRTIVFKNSFRMWDMLHCTGDLSVSDSVKREEIEVLTDDVFRRTVFLAENTASYSLNSGWLSGKQMRYWLEDLLLNTKAYMALGDYLMPIIIKTGKVLKHTDRENNYSLSITFEPDYRNEAFSAIVEDGVNYLTDSDSIRYTDDSSNDYFN